MSNAAELALAQSGAALVEVTVDPNEPLLPPKRIDQSLGEQPSRTMLQS